MTKLSEKIVGKIKHDHITPVPRWHFLIKSFAFWTFFVFSVVLGSLSFSVIVHIVEFGDIDIFKHLKGTLLTSAVMMLPYFWFLSVLLFAVIAYFNWKCTKMGYRFKRRWIVLGSVGLSIVLGSVFYALGMAKVVDSVMAKSVPFYDKSKHEARRELWLQPESGLLIGKIVGVDEISEELIIEDENGTNWNIGGNSASLGVEGSKEKGRIIKVIGKREGGQKFSAKEIRRCGDCDDDEDDSGEDDDNDEDRNSIVSEKSEVEE